ncbi:MAG: energy-coupling factor ABC transporter ATP-binding protein [Candidatus Hodarchaeales archaeon]
MMNEIQFAVEFNHVSFNFPTSKNIFESISFQIPSNACCLLLGPTGSGKTTILKIIKGIIPFFLPYRLDGSVSIFSDKKNISNFMQQNLDIGFLFQDTEIQFIGSTVEQDLAFGLENLGIPSNKINAHINQFKNQFPILNELLHRSPYTLSGGELTLVEFLATLITQPRLLLCDEPLAFFDNTIQEQFLKFLHNYLEKNTCIIATHTIEPFLDLATYVVAIDPIKKQFLYQGDFDEFLTTMTSFEWLSQPLMVDQGYQ